MTVLELIQKTTAYFEKAGVPCPRLDIELLLAHVLGLKRLALYMEFERQLTETELDILRPLVRRRAAREPLQHLLGVVEFVDVFLEVGPEALVPRPETEMMTQMVIDAIPDAPVRILDLGTGTGAILLAILQARPKAIGLAVDLSKEALGLARRNADRNQLSSRVEFREGDCFSVTASGETFDWIVSNPPYIPTADIAMLQPEVQFDPHLALDGGGDGLEVVRKIVSQAMAHLKPGGSIILELGVGQSEAVGLMLRDSGFSDVMTIPDLQQIPRFVRARKSIS